MSPAQRRALTVLQASGWASCSNRTGTEHGDRIPASTAKTLVNLGYAEWSDGHRAVVITIEGHAA